MNGLIDREGKLVEGTLIVFDPADDATPLGLYRESTRRTRELLGPESTSIAADSHSAGTPEANTVELTARQWQAVGYFALAPCGRGYNTVRHEICARGFGMIFARCLHAYP